MLFLDQTYHAATYVTDVLHSFLSWLLDGTFFVIVDKTIIASQPLFPSQSVQFEAQSLSLSLKTTWIGKALIDFRGDRPDTGGGV